MGTVGSNPTPSADAPGARRDLPADRARSVPVGSGDARDTAGMAAAPALMHRRRARCVVAVVAAALVVLAAPSGVGAAANRSGDQQIADDGVLTTGDVPTQFHATTPNDTPDRPPGPACAGIRTAAKALDAAPHDEVQFETTPDSAGNNALINNQVSVFASSKPAKAAYAPYAAKSAKACLETEFERVFLEQIGDPSAKVDVSAKRFVPGLGDASVGYRVKIDASAKGDSEAFYVDVEVVRTGRGVNAFGFFNSGSPPPSDDVVSMTETGVQRLENAL